MMLLCAAVNGLAVGNEVLASATPTTSACLTGTAVPDAGNNPGLVADCDVLLAARGTLAGAATLNWSPNTPIATWDGVNLGGLPQRVRLLRLPGVGLNGTIPSGLGNLADLRILDLSRNQLGGTIPSELGDLSNLVSLYLDRNQLNGTIPSELGGLPNLSRLWLGDNRLSGPIPPELGGLTNLTFLYLWGNQLSGRIPTELSGMANLRYLSLDGNKLSGPIPAELASLANLLKLYLHANQLSGPIPPELGNLSNLSGLALRNNHLSGSIPPELGNLTKLSELYLSANQLSGPIPRELGNLTNLVTLWLQANQLSGPIPPELGNLTNLVVLYLGGLSSCLPEAVRQLRPGLRGTDIDRLPACSGEDLVLTADEDPIIYNDNVFVLPVGEDLAILATDELPLRNYVAKFYKRFNDEFDFLILVSNLDRFSDQRGRSGIYIPISNNVTGIGKTKFSNGRRWGSDDALQGVIHLATFDSIAKGPSLHELMHRWANGIVPGPGEHWGFSSAKGQLGGFDMAELMDHGDGRYSAGFFGPSGAASNWLPYSPIELYLAGLIPPDEVPDLWVAEDGDWALTEDGDLARADDGDPIFSASQVRTYSINDIISQHGRRIPDASQAQRDFRAAAILLIDENHPAVTGVLDRISGDIASFTYAGPDEDGDSYNFYEATGGKATITMDGLAQFQKGTPQVTAPGAPTGLTVTGNSQTQLDLSWSSPPNDGGAAVTGYRIEVSADSLAWSDLVANTGSTATTYSHTGLEPGTTRHYRVSAINPAGAGLPSSIATGTTVPATDPEFPATETGSRNVALNTPAGANVGDPVAAIHPDRDSLTYVLSGTDAAAFDINASTGQIKVGEGTTLDPNIRDTYAVVVTATGASGASADITVTIMVVDLLTQYDSDENGAIGKREAIAAVRDYFGGNLTKDQTIAVIVLYFASGG